MFYKNRIEELELKVKYLQTKLDRLDDSYHTLKSNNRIYFGTCEEDYVELSLREVVRLLLNKLNLIVVENPKEYILKEKENK
jgi:hypothetical protein